MIVKRNCELDILYKLMTLYPQCRMLYYMVEDYYYETPFNNTSEAKIKHRLVAEWKPTSKKEVVKNFLDNSYPKTFQNLEHSIKIEVDGSHVF